MDKELQYQCLKIPIKALRNELPNLKSRKRQDFLDELFKINEEKLRKLAMHYHVNKIRSMYLFTLQDRESSSSISIQEIEKIIDKKITIDNDQIFIINQIKADGKDKSVYVKIKAYSAIRLLRGAHPQTLASLKQDYRRQLFMNLIIHSEDKTLECRANYKKNAELAAKIISKALFNNEAEFKQIILSEEQQNVLHGSLKAKRGAISGIAWSGCDFIKLEGEDIERAINEFKRNGLDFRKMGATIALDNRKSEDSFAFFSDGKISFKEIEDPYNKIRDTLGLK